jgi:hypothetical protein
MTDTNFELVVVRWEGNPAHCVYLNDTRIAGSKPWGGGDTQARWMVSLDQLRAALPDLEIDIRKAPPKEGDHERA